MLLATEVGSGQIWAGLGLLIVGQALGVVLVGVYRGMRNGTYRAMKKPRRQLLEEPPFYSRSGGWVAIDEARKEAKLNV